MTAPAGSRARPGRTARSAPAVSVAGLSKRYGDRVAVDDLTLDIPPGVVAGFIGPNGAGKTTTMAMLLGLVRPTGGSGRVLGEDLSRPERYLQRVGALVEGPALWPGLTGVENLTLLARLGGHDPTRIPEVLELVGLAERAADRVGRYSFGMKQRLGIGAALLGDPALLVLDEPTNGLDPVGINEMRELIGRVSSAERTVLVSSHLLGELEHVCDWLIMIDHGRLVYDGSAAAFAAQARPELVVGPANRADLPRLDELLHSLGLSTRTAGDDLVASFAAGASEPDDPRRLAATVSSVAGSAAIVLAELHVRRPTLETSYLRLVEGTSR